MAVPYSSQKYTGTQRSMLSELLDQKKIFFFTGLTQKSLVFITACFQ